MRVKDLKVSVKAGPDDGLAEGEFSAYASVFGNKDSYGDIVVKGAFADDLKAWEGSGNPIPLLFGHNMSDPDFNIGHVSTAVEDDHGLLVSAQLDMENPKAVQVYRLLKGRRINQMSFAYDVLDASSVERDGETVYELRKLHVYEVSVVTIGANEETEILAVKAAAEGLLAKAGRVLSAKNEAALKAAHAQLVGAAEEINNVLSALGGQEDDQSKASGTASVNEEEPARANSEEPAPNPSVSALALELSLLALG